MRHVTMRWAIAPALMPGMMNSSTPICAASTHSNIERPTRLVRADSGSPLKLCTASEPL